MAPFTILFTILSAALCTHAWGNLGHETIGFVAQQFLVPKALSFVQSTLGSTWNFSLGPAAIWADQVKSEAAFKWSAELHFVDAQDSPLAGECSVDEQRDCADQECILGAIANYTARVVDTSLAAEQTLEALLFLDHVRPQPPFPCPRTQRLMHTYIRNPIVLGRHRTATARRGVRSGRQRHLRKVLGRVLQQPPRRLGDTGMVTKHIDQSHGGTPEQYAADLVAEIKSGSFEPVAASWLACSSTTEPLSARAESETSGFEPGARLERELKAFARRVGDATITALECPIVWARESNAFDCTVVFDFTTGEDLCSGTYFDNAIPVIDLQLAKQGFRLAAWLNVLFDGATNLP